MEQNHYKLCETCQDTFDPRGASDTRFCSERCRHLGTKEATLSELEEMVSASIFHEEYKKARVWADLNKIVDKLEKGEKEKLTQALQTVKNYTGLSPREDYLLNILASKEKYGG